MSSILPIDAIFYGVLGLILGILLSWAYYQKVNKKSLVGKIIDTAMIEKNIYELEELSIGLIQLISKITDSSEELNRQIYHARDIELNLKSHYDLKRIKNIDSSLEDDIQEINE